MNDITKKEEPMVPGIGVAGAVMCPFMKGLCLKSACELWVELTYGDRKVARCSLSWMTLLSTEVRQSIDKLAGGNKGVDSVGV